MRELVVPVADMAGHGGSGRCSHLDAVEKFRADKCRHHHPSIAASFIMTARTGDLAAL